MLSFLWSQGYVKPKPKPKATPKANVVPGMAPAKALPGVAGLWVTGTGGSVDVDGLDVDQKYGYLYT